MERNVNVVHMAPFCRPDRHRYYSILYHSSNGLKGIACIAFFGCAKPFFLRFLYTHVTYVMLKWCKCPTEKQERVVVEQKQQQVNLPLRVRFRLSPERAGRERQRTEAEFPAIPATGDDVLLTVPPAELPGQRGCPGASAIDDAAGALKRVGERAEKIAEVASEAMEVTSVGQQQVDRANEGMRQVREATLQSARAIKRLGESGQEINDTVMELTGLTTRMNLLALNAAIEAVRAGEQGQGFAVIAQEIRALAAHSEEASRKVASRLHAIQSEVAMASQSVDTSIARVVVQCELVTQAGVALDAIGIVTEQMADLARGLSEISSTSRLEDASSP